MFGKAFAATAAALVLMAGGAARADEGMWPFDEAPVARMKDALGVSLDSHWLEHLRDASVRLTNGCSASIVSHEGLVLTNQHCIVTCAQQLSPPERDYVNEGYLAVDRTDERTCPGVQAEVLVAITETFSFSQVGQEDIIRHTVFSWAVRIEYLCDENIIWM